MKKRFCMTLNSELMAKIDQLVDGSKFKNRSQTAELLIKIGLEEIQRERTALILCGGLGTRLRPLTYVTPKPMLPIAGRPLLEYQIEYLKKYSFDRIILATGYLQEQIIRYFSERKDIGEKIIYSFEKEPLDTGGALKNAAHLLREDFLTLNSDVIFDSLDLGRLLEFHKSSGGLATVVLVKVREPSRYGLAELNSSNLITGFVEKPRTNPAEYAWINAGVYIISPKVLGMIRADRKVSLEKEIFPKLAKKRMVYGFKYNGYWSDVGTQSDYIKVCRDILTGILKVSWFS
ncbi:NTP transferase domain-containing protein [Candidatus Bathyarchaeota archaeon]|nr:NTP transferase domain-containing protein [Candidatus Bathyarchaeota archaeon]MBS7629006.1 NTP transferase domain-containing protein [Candidatus Bathyarchaeota archaeon]